jgi:hypothetical protein
LDFLPGQGLWQLGLGVEPGAHGICDVVSRKHRISGAEQLRRIDKAMGKPSDDPRQMANFVP